MQRFQETDGTEPHRKEIRFHAGKLLGVETPLHKTLRVEAPSPRRRTIPSDGSTRAIANRVNRLTRLGAGA